MSAPTSKDFTQLNASTQINKAKHEAAYVCPGNEVLEGLEMQVPKAAFHLGQVSDPIPPQFSRKLS